MAKPDELRNMSPEERIKRLKHMEEQNRREIDEAKRMIEVAQQEIKQEKETLRKIPIPQIKSIDATTLFGTTDKQIWEVLQFKSEEKPEEGEKPLEKKVQEEIIMHDEAVKQQIASASSQYKSIENLYGEAKAISQYQNLNPDQRDRLVKIYYDMKNTREFVEQMQQQNPDKYSDANQSMEEMADATMKMLKQMMGMYWKPK